jgi:hypothetical protein
VLQPTDDELIAACASGTPIPEAVKYAGAVHPLVEVFAQESGYPGGWLVDDRTNIPVTDAIDNKWLNDSWPSPIQLVVCIPVVQVQKVDSCGTYTRQSDGMTCELVLYRRSYVVRVVVASTGNDLQSKTLYGDTLTCSSNYEVGGDPPWEVDGPYPDRNAYATSVSTQKVT